MSEILTSMTVITRKRPKLLSENLKKFFDLASYPDQIECLIRIDDDDDETLCEYMTNDFFKQYKSNIKMFQGPRIGYDHQWKLLVQLLAMCRGDIIVPIGDDYLPCLPEWDKFCLKYRNDAVVLGCRVRMIFTKKVMEQHEILRNYAWKTRGADTEIFRYALANNIFVRIHKWFKRNQPKDDTYREGPCGKWALKDLSILENLPLIEVMS